MRTCPLRSVLERMGPIDQGQRPAASLAVKMKHRELGVGHGHASYTTCTCRHASRVVGSPPARRPEYFEDRERRQRAARKTRAAVARCARPHPGGPRRAIRAQSEAGRRGGTRRDQCHARDAGETRGWAEGRRRRAARASGAIRPRGRAHRSGVSSRARGARLFGRDVAEAGPRPNGPAPGPTSPLDSRAAPYCTAGHWNPASWPAPPASMAWKA